MRLKVNNSRLVVDDAIINDLEDYWTQCCEKHKESLEKDNANVIFDKCGEGICGIEGCEEQSNYYVDFLENSFIEINGNTN